MCRQKVKQLKTLGPKSPKPCTRGRKLVNPSTSINYQVAFWVEASFF